MSRGMYCLIKADFSRTGYNWFICPADRREEAEDILDSEHVHNIPDWIFPLYHLSNLQFPAFVIA